MAPFNSIKDGGTLIIEARNILIEGQLDGSGSGYSGGHQTNVNCQGGKQGKSIIVVGMPPFYSTLYLITPLKTEQFLNFNVKHRPV